MYRTCIGVQPCNPAVGGPAKSQLVHEVDALGGEMGKMADRTYVQKRVLNMSKVGLCLSLQPSGHVLHTRAPPGPHASPKSLVSCYAKPPSLLSTGDPPRVAEISVRLRPPTSCLCCPQWVSPRPLNCIVMQGPAVWSLRAQTDKIQYAHDMRKILEEAPNLALREGMAVDIDLGPNDEVTGVRTFFGLTFRCRAAVLTTGTFMNGRIWVGRASLPAGRYVLLMRLFWCGLVYSVPITAHTTTVGVKSPTARLSVRRERGHAHVCVGVDMGVHVRILSLLVPAAASTSSCGCCFDCAHTPVHVKSSAHVYARFGLMPHFVRHLSRGWHSSVPALLVHTHLQAWPRCSSYSALLHVSACLHPP